MHVKEYIKEGKLSQARQLLVEAVRDSPADLASRTLLFQVLSFCGEWQKADRHLEAIAAQDSSREAGVLGYRNLIHAEQERQEVISSNRAASFLADPPEYLDLYLSACDALLAQKIDEASGLFQQLDKILPLLTGTLNGTPFAGFRDTDSLLFPFLEVFAHDRYLWLPLESLRELTIEAPKSLCDLLWIPANVTTWQGFAMNCYLPSLYPNSFLNEDERIKMGRMTDWTALGGTYARGVGQRVFEVGEVDVPILELREVTFHFPKEKT